jgi:DHA2 family multidrug resistance protein
MRDRALFYGVYYGIARTLGEVAGYISLNFVEEYDWKMIFEVSTVAATLAVIVCLLLFTRERSQHAMPLYQMDWSSMILFGVAAMLLCYTLAMGLTQDWLESPKIWFAGILCIAVSAMFILRQYHTKRPYWNLRIFKNFKQVQLGFLIMIILYLFYCTDILFERYAAYNFRDMETYFAKITLVTIITYIIGFPATGLLLYKGFSTRIVIFFGFLCYAASLLYFYLIIQTTLSVSDLIIPYVLQGLAYTMLLTAAGTFMSVNVPRSANRDRVMATILGRYVLGAFAGSALFGNWLYRGMMRHSTYLSEHTTGIDYPFIGTLKGMAHGFIARGAGTQAAQDAALEIFKKQESAQAMLMSIKDISLSAGIAALCVAIIMLFTTRLDMHHKVTRSKYRIIPW